MHPRLFAHFHQILKRQFALRVAKSKVYFLYVIISKLGAVLELVFNTQILNQSRSVDLGGVLGEALDDFGVFGGGSSLTVEFADTRNHRNWRFVGVLLFDELDKVDGQVPAFGAAAAAGWQRFAHEGQRKKITFVYCLVSTNINKYNKWFYFLIKFVSESLFIINLDNQFLIKKHKLQLCQKQANQIPSIINSNPHQQLQKMSYPRVPQTFMKDIFLKPYSFSDPQNPNHGQFVSMQLKNDLYYSALNEISNIEFKSWGDEDEWIQVEKIVPCKGEDPKSSSIGEYFKKRNGRFLKEKQEGFMDLVTCEDWNIVLHRGKEKTESTYRVKILQTKTDIFRSQVYPPTFWKVLKDLYIN